MGAACQLDWQLGLTLINFNGSCQGTPGASTWQVWQTHKCTHTDVHVHYIQAHICLPHHPERRLCLFKFAVLAVPALLASPCHQMCSHLWERERERWFAVTMWADFWGGLFLSVTQPSNARGPSQQNRDTMESHEPRVRNVPGKNIPEGGWNQNSGKRRKSTCSANEKCTRHPLFTVVSMCICWRSLKSVDYVMLTEQANDVYCAKQATFSERGVGLPCSQRVVVNSHAQGGTGEVERLTVTGV